MMTDIITSGNPHCFEGRRKIVFQTISSVYSIYINSFEKNPTDPLKSPSQYDFALNKFVRHRNHRATIFFKGGKIVL